MKRKVYYYSDEVNDDFAFTKGKIRKKQIDENYTYTPKNIFWRFFAFIIYWCIAIPVAYFTMYVLFGLKVKNKKVLKKINGGFFLYGNHTRVVGDAFGPNVLGFPRKTNIIVNADAVSIPFVGHIVKMLNALPLPATIKATKNFFADMQEKLNKNQVITIYPEAHIWPFYNKIRPFSEASFYYPIKFGVPVVPFAVCYKERKIFKNLRPKQLIVIGEPVYPKDCINKKDMRDKVYNFMVKTLESERSVETHKFIKIN